MTNNIIGVYYDDWEMKIIYRKADEKETKAYKFKNYFYIEEKHKDIAIEESEEMGNKLTFIEGDFKTITNKKVIKCICSWHPKQLVAILNDRGVETYESDLSERVKFIVDNDIKLSNDRRYFLIDIETDMSLDIINTDKEITCIGFYDSFTKEYNIYTFNKDKNFKVDNCNLKIFDTEEEMLKEFIKYNIVNPPDIWGGWNAIRFDFPYIINRCKKLGIDINKIVTTKSKEGIKCENWRNRMLINIPGIETVDLIEIFKRITAYMVAPPNYKLDTIANFYLGKTFGKNVFNLKNYKEEFQKFLNYNFRDVELMKLLDEKMGIFNYCFTLQETCPVELSHITHNSLLLEMYLKLKYKNIILLDKPKTIDINGIKLDLKNNVDGCKIKGAFTGKYFKDGDNIEFINPTPGVYKNVEVWDFSGMYASIYSTFNLSIENMNLKSDLIIKNIEAEIYRNNDTKKDLGQKDYKLRDDRGILKKNMEFFQKIEFDTIFDLSERAILPQIIDDVRNKRSEYKEILKNIDKEKESEKYQKFKALSDVYKLLGNAMYGVFSFEKFRLYNPKLNATITKLARDAIVVANESLIKQGLVPLYSDTDSIFVWNNNKEIEVEKVNKILNEDLKNWAVAKHEKIKNWYCMNLEHEKSFKTLVLKDAKKRYFGILSNDEFVTKGFEIIRRDTPEKIKEILKELFIDLLEKNKIEMREKLKDIKNQIKEMSFDDLGLSLNIAKELDEYKVNAQHIRASKYSNKNFDLNIRKDDRIKMCFVLPTHNYPETNVISFENEIDIPKEFKIDVEKTFEHLIIKKLKLLENVKELNIDFITNKNKVLDEFF